MRALCICQYGHSRSVALTRVLRRASNGRAEYKAVGNYEAVALGWETAGLSAIALMSGWAEVIFILQQTYLDRIPDRHRGKVVVFDVGPDVWSDPYHIDLYYKLLAMLQHWEAEGRPLGNVYGYR
jgi:hypothetical protein